ncbi:MAG: hypothetical protein MMC23_005802, partial [Stictis urceolatum]|nr:hypothetical protein [Stictis urceolata]
MAASAMTKDTRKYRVTKSSATPRRRSVLLQENNSKNAATTIQQIPSPSSSEFKGEKQSRKRKRLGSVEELYDEIAPKKPHVIDHSTQTEYLSHDPIEHWVVNDQWPGFFGQEEEAMAPRSTSAPKSTSQESSNKRKSESTHRTDYLERIAAHGIFMKSTAQIQESSKELCKSYLQGSLEPTQWPCYPPEKISEVLERIDGLSESRIQRDVMPWVAPSAENLFFSGELKENWLGDDVQADWARCQTLGGTRPKPDYTAGLLRKAFTKEEIRKLQDYSAPSRPFLFT